MTGLDTLSTRPSSAVRDGILYHAPARAVLIYIPFFILIDRDTFPVQPFSKATLFQYSHSPRRHFSRPRESCGDTFPPRFTRFVTFSVLKKMSQSVNPDDKLLVR